MSEQRYIIIQKNDLHPEQIMALRYWLKAIDVQAVSEGYALVPIEPTGEMIAAAHHEVDQATIHNYGGPADPMDIWQAMIEAAQESDE